MSSAQLKGKYWMFTINNPIERAMPDTPDIWPGVGWVVWQRERGSEGTEHLQGYVQMKSQRTLGQMKKLNNRAHWERRRGSHDQAKAYCTKEDTRISGPFMHGEEVIPQQGKRNDLLMLKRKLDEGASEFEIARDDETFGCWARYPNVVKRYRMLDTACRRNWQTHTTVLWGEPGVGKSSRARDVGGENAFWLPKPAGSSVWWDGYEGQDVVVIDEFYGWIKRDMMCRLCDRYPLFVEVKGGAVQFVAKKIIITSNKHPKDWWPRIGLGAMERRLKGDLGTIIEMFGPNVENEEGVRAPFTTPVVQGFGAGFQPGAESSAGMLTHEEVLSESEAAIDESQLPFGPDELLCSEVLSNAFLLPDPVMDFRDTMTL